MHMKGERLVYYVYLQFAQEFSVEALNEHSKDEETEFRWRTEINSHVMYDNEA